MIRRTVEQALDDLRAGRPLIVVDDEGRENEGDIVMAAQFVDPEMVNFMARHGRGLICVAMTGSRLDELELPLMVSTDENSSGYGTAFTVSAEAATGVTTGISAQDRARTIRLLADPSTVANDLSRPGHIFPLRSREGGVLVRAGHTEASVDLAGLAGLEPVAVICEVMAEDGSMARGPELERFATRHRIGIVTIADLIAYRRQEETLVRRGVSTRLPTPYGEFTVTVFENDLYPHPDLALTMGDVADGEPVLVRVHSECLTGDVFGSGRCDCGDQLQRALTLIGTEGRGVLLYVRQEGRGIGLHNKLRAYQLQDQGLDTVEANEQLGFPADLRTYGLGAQALRSLGVRRVRLLTNNPRKVVGLSGHGLEIVERVPLVVPAGVDNRRYLSTKRERLGHLLIADPSDPAAPIG
ncbi:MAG TPA: bifunctional 3,4-dihydroxy-2-butanone-4-phosphate synthase/GTP cyclohydrolase II [Thermomicrobiales bacterium]|jgi:3,4-dihydroxy 2-butanone 4-phosphate synthase/GTP cyclohydrolase II|nr:bifunctional 3,4-dihydroxy-2-butanone-4-phosphate synthase/GTP cyclohydrolase II [Thermomicrobiales bacterium]